MSDDLVKRYTTYNVMMSKESGKYISSPDGKWVLFTDHADRIKELEAKLAKAVEHLEWFIENDETNRGDEPMPERRNQTWDEINSYWIEHLDAAIAFVLELKGEK